MIPCGHKVFKCIKGEPFNPDRDCPSCWRFVHLEKYQKLWGDDQQLPDTITQIKNFVGSVFKHVSTGMNKVSDDEFNRRIEICEGCDKYNDGRCTQCGCFLKTKASWVSEKCPLDKWSIPEMSCATVTEQMTVEQMIEAIRMLPPGPWPPNWAKWGNTIQAHVQMVKDKIPTLTDYLGGYKGRGIIIAAGGEKYFTCAWVCVKVLRALGCKLPIQFWHLGVLEMDPCMKKLVVELGVECVDAREVEKTHKSRILAGWELKPFSIMHCPFEEVLFLDADNVPTMDPEYLFDDPRYKDLGAIFWPDLPPQDRADWVPQACWDAFSMARDRFAIALESGQLLINKAKCWKELQLTMWINEHSDYYYGDANVGAGLVFGDKDTYLLAWHKIAQVENKQVAYAITSRPAGWTGGTDGAGAIIQHDIVGRVIFQHRCRPYPHKWSLRGTNGNIPFFINEEMCFAAIEELKKKWRGVLWHNFCPSDEEKAVAKSLTGKKFNYERIGLGERLLEFAGGSSGGGRIGEGSEDCERRWEIFIENEITTLAICRDGKPTCLLNQTPDGVWRGAWLEYEKCAVALTEIA